jgi:hypothetical protein
MTSKEVKFSDDEIRRLCDRILDAGGWAAAGAGTWAALGTGVKRMIFLMIMAVLIFLAILYTRGMRTIVALIILVPVAVWGITEFGIWLDRVNGTNPAGYTRPELAVQRVHDTAPMGAHR